MSSESYDTTFKIPCMWAANPDEKCSRLHHEYYDVLNDPILSRNVPDHASCDERMIKLACARYAVIEFIKQKWSTDIPEELYDLYFKLNPDTNKEYATIIAPISVTDSIAKDLTELVTKMKKHV